MAANPRKGWRKPSRIIPLVILALVSFGAVGIKVTSRSGLQREFEMIRAKGLPTNPKELDAWYAAVPDAENAGLKVLEAGKVYVAPSKGINPGDIDWRALPHRQPLDATLRTMLETHLAKNRAVLKLIHDATPLERSRYPTDISKAPSITFDHLVRVKNLTQLSRWEAVLKAEQGDAEGAARALKSGFALANTLAQEPLLISELVRIACLSIQLAGMERVVNVAKFSEGDLRDLAEVAGKAADGSAKALHRAFIGERAFGHTGLKLTFEEYEAMSSMGGLMPTSDEVPEFARRMLYNARRVVGIHDRDFAYYMRSMGRLVEATAHEHPQFLAESEAVSLEIQSELSRRPYVYLLSNISLPSMMHVAGKEAQLVARLRCLQMALEVERFRAMNGGGLPRVEELGPGVFREVRQDPVDGRPLKYEPKLDQGYRIVAEGATALERKRNTGPNVRDVAFTIER